MDNIDKRLGARAFKIGDSKDDKSDDEVEILGSPMDSNGIVKSTDFKVTYEDKKARESTDKRQR